MIIKRKKLERQFREAMQEEIENFEKTIFECRVFSRIQKYLKAIRKTPAISPFVKYGDKKSSCGDEQWNMFNDYFISVINAQLIQSNEITFFAPNSKSTESNSRNCFQSFEIPGREQSNGS